MNTINILENIVSDIKREFPKFKFCDKDKSILIKIIYYFLYVITFGSQKKFMTNYVTTIGTTIYTPTTWSKWSLSKKVMILKHERIHLRQAKKYGSFLYSFLYIFAWLPLVFATYRTKFEKEAYMENIKYAFQIGGEKTLRSDFYKEEILSYFLTGKYFWMCPFRKKMEAWYNNVVEDIISGNIT